MRKNSWREIEDVLLNQIETLNEEFDGEDAERARTLIDKSRAIGTLVNNFTELQRVKLEIAREMLDGGSDKATKRFLGVAADEATEVDRRY